jgi:hypothetical protein
MFFVPLDVFSAYLKYLNIDSKSTIHFYFYHFGTGFDSNLEYQNLG